LIFIIIIIIITDKVFLLCDISRPNIQNTHQLLNMVFNQFESLITILMFCCKVIPVLWTKVSYNT